MMTHSWTIQWYCYQKTDPVCETYDFLYTWTKTTQAYGSRWSKDMSSTHIFWILSNLKPLTNTACWNCHNQSAYDQWVVGCELLINCGICETSASIQELLFRKALKSERSLLLRLFTAATFEKKGYPSRFKGTEQTLKQGEDGVWWSSG